MSNDSRNDIIAGSARGVAQIMVGHPLDTMKVRLQTQNRLSAGETARFHSLIGCFRKTIELEGWRGFWKGCTSPLAGCALYSASLFFAYGQAKKIVQLDPNNPTLTKLLIVGGMTGGSAAFIECPIDTVKARLQVQYQNKPMGQTTTFYNGSIDCVKQIFKERGIRGLYQGFSATVLRNIPGSMAYFSTYETLKKGGAALNLSAPVGSFIAGGFAGLIFWATIFPVDVVKSCIQTDCLHPNDRTYPTLLSAFKGIYKLKGMRGFWSGFSACAVRAFPVNAASFLVYESVRKMLPE